MTTTDAGKKSRGFTVVWLNGKWRAMLNKSGCSTDFTFQQGFDEKKKGLPVCVFIYKSQTTCFYTHSKEDTGS